MGNLGSTANSPCRVGDCMINMSSSCFLGNCSRLNPNITILDWKTDTCTTLNQSTCSMLTLESSWDGELSYDEEGCFVNNDLRNTPAYDQYLRFSMMMGILLIAFGCFGLVGNLLSIIVLNTKDMKSNCFNNLLTALNTTDSLHIVFAILEVVRYDFPAIYSIILPHPNIWPYVHYPVYRICFCASIYLIIGVGVERYLAVCRPHHYREVQGRSNRALMYILPALACAVLINMTKFLEVEVAEHCVDYRHCNLQLVTEETFHKPSELRTSEWYVIYYHCWFWVVVTGLVPFIILTVLSANIYTSMERLKRRLTLKGRHDHPGQVPLVQDLQSPRLGAEERRKIFRTKRQSTGSNNQAKECNLAFILICTTVTFFLLHLPRVLASLYEALTIKTQLNCAKKHKDFLPLWFLYILAALNTLLVVNASSNILIYIFVGQSFREKVKKILRLQDCKIGQNCFFTSFIQIFKICRTRREEIETIEMKHEVKMEEVTGEVVTSAAIDGKMY